MGKGKPRHNPDKPANRKGDWCGHCEELNGILSCNYDGIRAANICKGNPHNCIKTRYHRAASRSNIQIINDI